MSRRNFLLGLNALTIGTLGGLLAFPSARRRLSGSDRISVTGSALVGGPFSLIDHHGRRVTDISFHGRSLLVVFGTTRCPDICPATLQTIAAVLNNLGGAADRVTPVLITLDPEYDSADVLAAYVARFHSRLVGLTGSAEEIDATAKLYKVHYNTKTFGNRWTDLPIEQVGRIHLIDSGGNFVTSLTHDVTVDALFQAFTILL